MLTINFIGCGRLGKTIAKLIFLNKIATIRGVINSTVESSINAVKFIGQGIAINKLNELPEADITFITTRDDNIKSICDEIVKLSILKHNSIVIHCSGSLSSDVLMTAKKINCLIASTHPARSFANPQATVDSFNRTLCSYEGDKEALPVVRMLFEGIGGQLIEINKERKSKYHVASVMANNYLVALHYHAMNNFIASGIKEETAHQLVAAFMEDAFNNLKTLQHKLALTGPIQRGDVKTIKNHTEILEDDAISRAIYASLGLGTIPLTDHSNSVKKELGDVLNHRLYIKNKLK